MDMIIARKWTAFFCSDIALPLPVTRGILYALFFCSGLSALLYQIMWERMLFTEFGVDLESITIIVSVFMFGLGIGGLWGGYLADSLAAKLLGLYVVMEMGIALFGWCSPDLINMMGVILFTGNKWATVCASFLVLAFPTILMGATFPVLVTHVNQSIQNIGSAVGGLYFVNTLGAALGAYFAGFVLLYTLDIGEIIQRAALLNTAIAFVAFLVFRKPK